MGMRCSDVWKFLVDYGTERGDEADSSNGTVVAVAECKHDRTGTRVASRQCERGVERQRGARVFTAQPLVVARSLTSHSRGHSLWSLPHACVVSVKSSKL